MVLCDLDNLKYLPHRNHFFLPCPRKGMLDLRAQLQKNRMGNHQFEHSSGDIVTFLGCLFFFFFKAVTPRCDSDGNVTTNSIYIFLMIYLFIYLWLYWVFVSVRGLSLVVASWGHSSSWCAGLSLSRPLLLRSTGSRRAGSVVVAHRPSCSAACGIFPDQGLNPCSLHWQADSQPLRHQGSPLGCLFKH